MVRARFLLLQGLLVATLLMEFVASAAPAALTVADEVSSEPSIECVQRLLAPIDAMAGFVPRQLQSSESHGPPPESESNESLRDEVVADSKTEAERANDEKPWFEKVRASTKRLAEAFRSNGIQAVIATVPDPIDSGLVYQFETALQALRLGFERPLEDATFYRDRSWLPWDDREVAPDDRPQSERCRRELPGIVLFRGKDTAGNPSVAALLLIGESPTSGVKQAAMKNALRIETMLAQDVLPEPRDRLDLRIIGPTFSGSARSLRFAIRDWAEEHAAPSAARREASDQPPSIDFHVVSGTATGSEVPRLLTGSEEVLANGSTMDFSMTTVSEAVAECAFLWFLKRHLGVDDLPGVPSPGASARTRLQGVATLRESGTEFGATVGSRIDANDGRTHPTESGSQSRACEYAPALALEFPYHVSALRDAYEDLDHRGNETGKDPSEIARATFLDASLRDPRIPLDLEATPSAKTRTALDMSLRNVLRQISRRDVRYLSIHATDIGDAIFLARRVRDVAPDVRLAFFGSDAHLLHSQYRRELLGSLVISAYPYLGVNAFMETKRDSADGTIEPFRGFESDHAEALYNATLAQRHAGLDLLSNYVFGQIRRNSEAPRDATSVQRDAPLEPLGSCRPDRVRFSEGEGDSPDVLPVWIVAIGREQFVPLRASPSPDCANTVFRRGHKNPSAALCKAESKKERREAWADFNTLRSTALPLDSDTSLPHTWDLLFGILLLGFWADTRSSKEAGRRFAPDPLPPSTDEANDLTLDRAIGRTKWRFYRVIRTFLFAMVFMYMGASYLLMFVAQSDEWPSLLQSLGYGMVIAAIIASVICTMRVARAFWEDYSAFASCVGARRVPRSLSDVTAARSSSASGGRSNASPNSASSDTSDEQPTVPTPHRKAARKARKTDRLSARGAPLGDRLSRALGVTAQRGKHAVAHNSFAQLRLLLLMTVLLAGAFTGLLVVDTVEGADWFYSGWGQGPVPAMTFAVLRNTSLRTGVSPATPALLCMGCVYLWAAGRMARLSLAHHTSRCSPIDGEDDLVSTPIRLILHPGYKSGRARDDGFTAVERSVLNSVWRPILGYRVVAALLMAAFPVLLFSLKPFSTLEGPYGTWLLGGGLVLCVFLIGVTLLQLDQYWRALKELLKRTREHPLGPAFKTLPPFARDTVDHQVSRSPNELLRWAGCARDFGALVASSRVPMTRTFLEPDQFERMAEDIESMRIGALALNVAHPAPSLDRVAVPPADRPTESCRQSACGALAEAKLAEALILAASAVTEVLEGAWSLAGWGAASVVNPVFGARPTVVPGALQGQGIRAGTRTSSLPVAVGDDSIQPTLTEMEISATAPDTERAVPSESGIPPAPARPFEVGAVRMGREPAEAKPKNDGGETPVDDALARAAYLFTADEQRWLRSAQTFVATVVAVLIHRHVRQFRYFLHALTGCSLLLLLAVMSYAFEPYRLLLTFTWIVAGSVVAMCLWTFYQMDRNTLISYIAGKSSQRLTLNVGLLVRVVAWTLIPLLTMAATQYPELANFLHGLIKPFVGVLQ